MADRIDLIHSYSKHGKGPANKGPSSSKPSFVAMVYPNDHGYGKKKKKSKVSTVVQTAIESAEDEDDLFPEALEKIDSYKKTKWTQPEKDFVKSYVNKHHLTHSVAYWSRMAKELNKKFNRSRTGSTCRIFYKRITEEMKSVSSKTVNASSQTENVFPFLSQPSPERRGQTEETNQQAESDSKAGSKHKSLDSKQKKKLLSVINSSDIDSLVQCIYSCDVLKEKLWEVFQKEIH